MNNRNASKYTWAFIDLAYKPHRSPYSLRLRTDHDIRFIDPQAVMLYIQDLEIAIESFKDNGGIKDKVEGGERIKKETVGGPDINSGGKGTEKQEVTKGASDASVWERPSTKLTYADFVDWASHSIVFAHIRILEGKLWGLRIGTMGGKNSRGVEGRAGEKRKREEDEEDGVKSVRIKVEGGI